MNIYPPLIADSIPAFIKEKIIIPFTDNPAVSISDTTTYYLRIININNNEIIKTFGPLTREENSDNFIDNTIHFSLEQDTVVENTYYKIQLGYEQSNAYSQVSIGYCIGDAPNIELEPENNYCYIAKYTHKYENLYSYQFQLIYKNQVIQDSGKRFQKNQNEPMQFEIQYNTKNYNPNDLKLVFIGTTMNGYVGKTEIGNINNIYQEDIQSICSSNLEEGYNILKDIGENSLVERSEDGRFWECLGKTGKSAVTLYDYSVEHGKSYMYAINKNIVAKNIVLNFEDMYLCDNEKQLNIKFNPKISNFKLTTLEQKIETIGGKYPFFFRNNKVGYKEISISGLISYHMDSNQEFISLEELGLDSDNHISTASLFSYNFLAERIFRERVYEWLNNGQPKLFRSPSEGNIVLRLMNITLSPLENLGRMVYSFTATGYEVGEDEINRLIQKKENTKFTPRPISGYFVKAKQEEENE